MSQDILVVDDEPDIRELIAGVLEDEGYSVRTAGTSQQAIEEVRARTPRLLVLDVWLEGSDMDGLSLLRYLKTIDADLPVIVISGHGNIETAVAAIRRGAYDFIEKPFKTDRLLHLVERALEAARLIRENARLRKRTAQDERWIGESSSATAFRALLDKVAPTNSRILIRGPAGAGKELVARLIHQASKRKAGPFISFNAASARPELCDRILFGEQDHSGKTVQVGLFEMAHTGTLLLDEVAELPEATQKRVLRVLTEGAFQRVNGHSDVKIDVRVISACSKDLRAEIDAGNFREDLFFRLNVVDLEVPALTDRRDDVPQLVEYFAERIAQGSGLNPRAFSPEAMAVLQSMEWPGNIRQLRNVVERILILSPADASRPVSVDELPKEVNPEAMASGRGTSPDFVGLTLRDAREQFEREYLELQMTRFNGNVSRTAEFIGMERSALHRKLKALGIVTGQGRG